MNNRISTGYFLAVAATVIWAGNFIVARALLFLSPFYALECWIYHPVAFNLQIALALLYVGVLSSVVAFLAWNQAIALIGPSRTALIYYLIPVFSGIAAWMFLGEAISWVHIFSTLAIVCGIIITNSTEPSLAEIRNRQKE